MKTIIYNYDNLNEEEITREIKRAKVILINSNDEILLGNSNNTYHLPGGHVEDNESFDECLVREVIEETGIDISNIDKTVFMEIIYMNRNYPNLGDNTKSIIRYYYCKCDLSINNKNMSLTTGEIDSNFKLEYIHKDNVIDVLEKNLLVCNRIGAVKDTIEAIKEAKEKQGIDLEWEVRIIGKNKKYLITMDSELIPINDIEDIESC